MSTQVRPTGVTILAVLAIIGGVILIVVGLMGTIFGGVLGGALGAATGDAAAGAVGGLVAIAGLFAIVVGGVYLAAGFGLWRLAPWAWLLTMIGAVLGVIQAAVQVIGSFDLVSAIVGFGIPAIIIYYLLRPEVKAVFGRA